MARSKSPSKLKLLVMMSTAFRRLYSGRAGAVLVAAFAVSCLAFLYVSAGAALATGDANEAFCPNESLAGFTTYLPDCRGYELLSPAYEDGQPLILHFISEESEEGPHAIFYSLGDAAGADGETARLIEPTVLEIGHNGSSAWGAVSLAPAPGDEVADSADELMDASANFGATLWAIRPALQSPLASYFYRRSSRGGSFADIGPIFSKEVTEKVPALPEGDLADAVESSNYYYEGSSSNLERILFVLDANTTGGIRLLWPGDMTRANAQSLYEYSGVGDTVPTLVGVEGGKGSAALISSCGTDLGSSSYAPLHLGSVYNAIADEGTRVFFTAVHSGSCKSKPPLESEASELYARIDGENTVAISEPRLPPGAECTSGHKCFGAVHKEGIFQGASQNGSKVFFLTEQPLVNGDEDNAMDLYEAELEGQGENAKVGKLLQISHDPSLSQAAEVQGVAKISMDGSHVYFVAKGELAVNANSQGKHAALGADNLYLFEQDARYPEGHVSFVVTLSSADEADWSRQDARPVETNECRPREDCEDGRYLVFLSRNHLTSTDTSETSSHEDLPQIFEYDASTGEIARVSIGEKSNAYPGGYNQDGNISEGVDQPRIDTPSYNYEDSPVGAFSRLSVSSNGSRIVFTSQDALTPGSGLECAKAYEYRSSGPISNGNVFLISDGHDITGLSSEDCGPQEVLMDPSGADIFFQSGDPLVPGAGSGIIDFYDAREGGGSIVNSGSTGCSEEACRPETVPPLLPAATSVSQVGKAPVTRVVTIAEPTKKSKPHKAKKKKRKKKAGRKTSHRGKARK